jgi:hypothetical protein
MSNREGLKADHDIIVEGWQILKKYNDIKDTEDYWDGLVDECAELQTKGVLGHAIGGAILSTIDQRNMNRKRGIDRW